MKKFLLLYGGKSFEHDISCESAKNIINALKEALSQGKKSLRSVDKILLSWAKREDLESEGKTPIDDDWTKNLEETIRIAKTPWLDDDEV